MDLRERGFVTLQRQVQSSPVWLSLTGEQRSVFISLLLLANWVPGRFMYGTEWVEVDRGELAHSLETIAKHAAVSIKVVRTAIAKLLAGHVLGTRAGTPSGKGPRVLRVLNYNAHQSVGDDEGTPKGTATGTAGARHGHSTGTPGAPIEPEEPREPGEPLLPLAPSPPVSPPSAVVVVLPCVGTGPKAYGVTDAQLDGWRSAFPGLDVTGEVRKAAAWCEANPSKRKTFRGIPNFLVSWLSRAQDKGGSQRPGQSRPRHVDGWEPAPPMPPDPRQPLFAEGET
jgi:hypothetical protein